eukprot:gene6507-7251_t
MLKFVLVLAFAGLALGFKLDPFKYLEQYGYTEEENSKSAFSPSDYTNAIKRFQKFAHLPITGNLDDATITMMQMPRCGVKDIMPASSRSGDVRRKKRYVASSRYRRSRDITYRFLNYSPDLGRSETRRIIKLALDMWSNVTNLSFTEKTSGSATLMLKFEGGSHGCYYPFDGPGGVIAHAFYPDQSGVHFDEDEVFTDGENRGRNLLWVAAHEFGHSLGLPHSDVYEALMYPFYKGYKPDFKLPDDDIGAVQALYDSAPFDGLLMERWLNNKGMSTDRIEPDVCIYPHQPDSASVLKTFQAPSDSRDDLATRIRGYYTATQSGYNRFYICADKSAKLYVSSSVNPRDKKELVKVKYATGQSLISCRSSSVYLQSGQKYYVEAIHKDGQKDDYLKVGVKPQGAPLELLSSSNTKWALVDTSIQIMICKGRYETITCPSGYEIEIEDSAYGLFKSNPAHYDTVKRNCNFDHFSDRSGTRHANCKAPSSQRVVTAKCQKKQQCTLHAFDSEFSDHCGERVYSVLDVTYSCRPTGTVTTPLPQTTQPPTKAPCEDRPREAPHCPAWKKAGYCETHPQLKTYYCRKTCDNCP